MLRERPPTVMHYACCRYFSGAFSNELKACFGGPWCFKAGFQPWRQHRRMWNKKKKKRNHTTEQCHAAPAHTPAFDHPQPAMPHMISFLFICKAGAVESTKWSYCWTSDESGLKCHMKLINQGQVDVAVVGECSKSPGWRLNMLFKSLTCSFVQTTVKFTITESQDGLDFEQSKAAHTAPPP